MNDKQHFEITLSDLRLLGQQGGATAFLDDGTKIELKPNFCIEKRTGFIGGDAAEVSLTISYAKIYRKIRTIKRHQTLVARRVKCNGKEILQSTGRGYTRSKISSN